MCVKMLTFIAVSGYHAESQRHSEYTQKLYNNIWFHRGSEHIPYYNLQKSTLQKFKILNIKKYNCRNRCRTGTRNCSGWKSVRQQGDATIQNKAGVLGPYLQRALETTTGGRNRNIIQKELHGLKCSYKLWSIYASREYHFTGNPSTGSML